MTRPNFAIEDPYLLACLADPEDDSRRTAYGDYLLSIGERFAADTFSLALGLTFRREVWDRGLIVYRCRVVCGCGAAYTAMIEMSELGLVVLNEHERMQPVLVRLARVCELIEAGKLMTKEA